jgi:hypothetical protein
VPLSECSSEERFTAAAATPPAGADQPAATATDLLACARARTHVWANMGELTAWLGPTAWTVPLASRPYAPVLEGPVAPVKHLREERLDELVELTP